jgi:hypothetical protein
MSSITSVGGGFAAYGPPDPGRMRQRMFDKADADGSGGIDASELKGALAKLAEDTGQDVGDADELLTKWDANGDGILDIDEMDTGMKSLMPPPSSTMEFAQRQGGMPPPPPLEEGEDAVSSTDTRSAADQLARLVESLTKAMDTNGDQSIGADEVQDFLSQLRSVDTSA